MTDDRATDLAEVIYVLRLSRDGQLGERNDWTTYGFVSAIWNELLTNDDEMHLTDKGHSFLAKFGALYPESDERERLK